MVKLQLPEPFAIVVPIDTPPSYTVTVAFASAVPLKVGVVLLVRLSLDEVPLSDALSKSGVDGAEGAEASIVTVKPLEATE